jgi:MocE subfamily Rieske [2Fe-2S] domain protein
MNVSAEPNVNPSQLSDYSLVGVNAAAAVEKGLAEAEWYQSPVPREIMRELLVRRDGPAIRDTLLWFALMAFFGGLGILLWGTWWAVIPFALYGILWGSSSDSRWHESSHGTAFRTDWMNNFLYEVSSFMVMRESTVWRWSHTRHHSDTIVVGRDPEIAVPRPPDLKAIVLGFLGIPAALSYFRKVFLHAAGRLDVEEATYIPSSEGPRIFLKARIVLMIYLGVVAISLATYSILPLMLVGLPNFYGAWLMPIYGLTQHAGLAENVLDHRMNCRTVRMNFVNRYLYWNMNFHVEHHMFPLVPYHNLPRLHEVVKADMPIPYASLWDAWKEIVPAVLRQIKDPGYFVKRKLPTPTVRHLSNQAAKTIVSSMPESESGWVEIGPIDLVDREEVIRFDHAGKTFAVYRTAAGDFHATDGICTHGNTHLATGFLKGNLIECPKHNGRFDIRDGGTRRPPVCLALKTYPIRIRSGKLEIGVDQAGGEGAKTMEKAHRFRVVSNENVATFIRELILEPAEDITPLEYLPGQYLQFEIPVYDAISFRNFEIRSPYDSVWKTQHVYDYEASNQSVERRNYSLASNVTRLRQIWGEIRGI